MKISLLVTTRKRIDFLQNMWRTANSTRSPADVTDANGNLCFEYKHDIELVLCVDDDDVETRKFYYDHLLAYNTILILGPRPTILGETTNRCFKESTGEICMLCTDDVVFHTNGWDDIVVKEFEKYPDKIALIYGEDGIQHGNTATLPFVHRNWVKTVGRFLPTHFINEFGDRWLTDVATKVGRRVYLPDLYIQHLHPAHGGMPYDDTYTYRMNLRRQQKGTRKECIVHYNSLEQERVEEANKLQNFILNFKG